MNKKDLLEKLKDVKDTAIIILSSDEEGNDYGVLFEVEIDKIGNVILFPASGTVEMG